MSKYKALDEVAGSAPAVFRTLADEVRAEMAAEKAAKLDKFQLEAQRKAKEASKPPIKASEAYGQHEGSYIKPIFYDRMQVDLSKGKFGGPGFSGIQLIDPEYAKARAVAGVTDKKMGTRILNRNKAQVPKGAKVIWTPSVGGLEQHKSNSTMFSEFADIFANQRKKMSPEQIQKLSDKASTTVDNNGRLIFPNGIDLGSRNFRKAVKTYDQRALMADIFAGRGVGGEKGRTVPMEQMLQKNLDPNMAQARTLDLGNRLFRLDDNVIDRPDLHSDYPIILTGEDLDVNYLPTPIASVFEDFKAAKELEKGRDITQMDYTKNDPTQLLSEDLLTRLQKAGYRKGGLAHMAGGGVMRGMKALRRIADDVEVSMPSARRANKIPTEPVGKLSIMREDAGQWAGGDLNAELEDLRTQAFSPNHQKMLEESIAGDRVRAAKGDKAAADRVELLSKELEKGLARRQWVNSNLKNYIKKQMGTRNDPVRKLAEKGVTHLKGFTGDVEFATPHVMAKRKRAGMPVEGVGESPEAKTWETLSDRDITSQTPTEGMIKDNPWMKDLPADERVIGYKPSNTGLGFEDLVEDVYQRLDNDEIRPDQLNKVTVADAVKSVNDKRVREEQAAIRAMENNKATKTHKEYPTGYRWVEISANKDTPLPEGWSYDPAREVYIDPNGQSTIHNPIYLDMQAALEHEGNVMGHCVGSYCDDVWRGNKRILSLRDPKGESHATVEVKPVRGFELGNYAADLPEGEDVAAMKNPPVRIAQIKGKQDEPVIDKYRSMVHDLVNTGKWHDVDDLHYAGLQRRGNVLTEHEAQWLRDKGYQVPEYIPQKDVEVMRRALYDNNVPDLPPKGPEGMAKGGVAKAAKKVMSLADEVKAEMAVDRVNMAHKDVLKRTPELQEAAALLEAGKMSPLQYKALVDKYKPITPYTTVPDPASEEQIMGALTKTNREAQGLPPKQSYYGVPSQTLAEGDPVGLRLDIPSYDTANTWVVTAHGPRKSKASGGAGTRIGYEPVAAATEVEFSVSPKAALGIAKGASKSTIATMEGRWKPTSAAEAKAAAELYLKDPDWVQVGMDPERHSYFYDRATRQPVVSAEHVIQIGPLVLAKKPKYGKPEDFPFAGGGLAHMDKGGSLRAGKAAKTVMSLADEVRAEMAAEKAAKLANPPTNVKVEPAFPYADRLKQVKPVYGARKILPREQADANKAAFLEPSVVKDRMYHGTRRNFTRFSPTTADSIFVTPDPTFASGFAHGALEFKDPFSDVAHGRYSTPDTKFADPDKHVDNANVVPVRVQVKNPFDYDKPEHVEALRQYLHKNSGLPKDHIDRQLQAMTDPELSANWTQMEHPTVQRAIKNLGHDAYYTKELDTKNLGIYNPNAVKSDIGNIGTWRLDTPEMTEKKGGLIATSRTA
jgi:hypothetical protein